MAVTQIVGLMGFGKSYEATNFIALRHFADGRRIVSNVRGLDEEEYRQNWTIRAKREFPKLPCNGSILFVTPADVRDPGFFPDPEDDQAPAVVAAGDVVILDELGAIWPSGTKPTPRVIRFLTQHRHFDDPLTGRTIEILFLYQMDKLIPAMVRDLAQTTIAVRKHLAFGALGKLRYVTNTFIGSEVKGKSMATVQRKIDPKLPKLYKTTRHGLAVEVNLDDRHSRKTIRVALFMLFACLFLPFMSWVLIHHFRGMAHLDDKPQASHVATTMGSSSGVASTPVAVARAARPAGPMPSVRWRIVGFVRAPLRYVVLLQDAGGTLRVVPAGSFSFAGGQPVGGIVDGEAVSDATGLPIVQQTVAGVIGAAR